MKIRGFRIELTEVESVIREYPGVTDATVVARDAPAGGKMICAYVVSDSPVDIPSLERFIQERKPPYMVPAVTTQIDKIPLNVNGKVDKRALPEPALAPAADEAAGPGQKPRWRKSCMTSSRRSWARRTFPWTPGWRSWGSPAFPR